MDNSTVLMNKCNKCGEEKPITEFNKHKLCKSGYRSQCKTCSSLYYEANKERLSKNNKDPIEFMQKVGFLL